MGSLLANDPLPALDARLCALARGTARLRLALGEALERLGRVGGPMALGFSSMSAYAVERCGYSGRWAEEARGLARRLVGLPRLRAALERGVITWSMAQLIARHARAETEAELVAAAATATVRAMRSRLEPDRGELPEPAEPDEPPCRRTLEMSIPVEDAWAFERARWVVEAVTGERAMDVVVEAMLAETLTSVLPPREVDLAVELERAHEVSRWRAETRALDTKVRERMEAVFEPQLAPRPAIAPPAPDGGAAPDDARDPAALDRVIVRLAGELRGHDLAIGRLALELDAVGGWRGLGYLSFAHWSRERLGISRSAILGKMALARRCESLPALGEALRDGRIGTASATLIGRVADVDTAAGWVERAAARTYVHLREEVEAAGLLARVSGDRGWLAPPDDETLAAVHEVERAALAPEPEPGPEPGEVRMNVAEGGCEDPPPPSAKLGGLGWVPWRVTIAADLADMWLAVRRLHTRRGDPRTFVRALSDNILRHWVPPGERRPFEAVYRRDRYRCQSPTCDRREVGAHHIVFRAHGGGDEPANCVTLCGRCHLSGVHAGRIRVGGTAPSSLRWTFSGTLVVEGRNKDGSLQQRGDLGTARVSPDADRSA